MHSLEGILSIFFEVKCKYKYLFTPYPGAVSIRPIKHLSPNIQIHILLTDLRTFSYSISWENLLKDQSNLPFRAHFINSHSLFF